MSMPDRRFFIAFAASFALFAGPLAAQTGGTEAGKTSSKDALSQKESHSREAVEHYLRAKLYAQESEFEVAVREFKRAVELDPTDGGLRREYGELLRDLPVYPEAETRLARPSSCRRRARARTGSSARCFWPPRRTRRASRRPQPS